MVNKHGDRFRPLRIGSWDPLQMAELHGLYMGVILSTEPIPGMILQVDFFLVPLPLTLTWPMAKVEPNFLGITCIFSRENKPFKLFFQGPGRLSEVTILFRDLVLRFER